jgi:GAF domain-containing protein
VIEASSARQAGAVSDGTDPLDFAYAPSCAGTREGSEPANSAENLQHSDPIIVFNAISASLGKINDPDQFIDVALAKCIEALRVEAGAIAFTDDTNQDLVFKAHQGWRFHNLVDEGTRIPTGTSVWSSAAHEGRVIVVNDVANDPRIHLAQIRREGIKTLALAPIQATHRVVGVLSVMSYHPHTFSQQDQGLLTAIANRVGHALEKADLFSEAQRRLQQQSALHEVAMATQGVLSLQTVMEGGLRALVALFYLDTAAIQFVDANDRLFPVAFQGSATQYWRKLQKNPLQLQDTLAGNFALAKKSHLIQDVDTFQEEIHHELRSSGMRTLADVPLLVGGRMIGILGIGASRPSAITLDDIPLLESLASQLASAIEAARLHEQTERRVQNLTTLTWVSASLNRTLNLDNVLDIVLDEILGLVNHPDDKHIGAILLVEPNQKWLHLAAAQNLPEDTFTALTSLSSAVEAQHPLLWKHNP